MFKNYLGSCFIKNFDDGRDLLVKISDSYDDKTGCTNLSDDEVVKTIKKMSSKAIIGLIYFRVLMCFKEYKDACVMIKHDLARALRDIWCTEP